MKSEDKNKWASWRLARLLAFGGALAGIIAVVLFMQFQANLLHEQMSLNQLWDLRGFRFMMLLGGGFLLTGAAVVLTFIRSLQLLAAFLFLMLGTLLLGMSTLSLPSLGGYTFYPSAAILGGGIVGLVRALRC